MEQIYKRLQNGESSEAIAAEFTAALNEAMARHAKEEEERAAQAEAKRLAKLEADARNAAKREEMVDLIDATLRYIAKHYPAIGLTENDWDDEELRAVAEMLILALDLEVIKATRFATYKPRFEIEKFRMPSGKETTRAVPAEDEEVEDCCALDPFHKFFKEVGLL